MSISLDIPLDSPGSVSVTVCPVTMRFTRLHLGENGENDLYISENTAIEGIYSQGKDSDLKLNK